MHYIIINIRTKIIGIFFTFFILNYFNTINDWKIQKKYYYWQLHLIYIYFFFY